LAGGAKHEFWAVIGTSTEYFQTYNNPCDEVNDNSCFDLDADYDCEDNILSGGDEGLSLAGDEEYAPAEMPKGKIQANHHITKAGPNNPGVSWSLWDRLIKSSVVKSRTTLGAISVGRLAADGSTEDVILSNAGEKLNCTYDIPDYSYQVQSVCSVSSEAELHGKVFNAAVTMTHDADIGQINRDDSQYSENLVSMQWNIKHEGIGRLLLWTKSQKLWWSANSDYDPMTLKCDDTECTSSIIAENNLTYTEPQETFPASGADADDFADPRGYRHRVIRTPNPEEKVDIDIGKILDPDEGWHDGYYKLVMTFGVVNVTVEDDAANCQVEDTGHTLVFNLKFKIPSSNYQNTEGNKKTGQCKTPLCRKLLRLQKLKS
jgi:hypothetical protein